jgi:hypothetical protein
LPADLGHHPAREDGDEAQWRAGDREAQERAERVETAVPAQPQAEQADGGQQQADPNHDAEGIEHDRHRRSVLRWYLAQPLDLAVPRVGQDHAAESGDADLVAVGGGRLVGDREQQHRDAARGLPVPLHRRHLHRLVMDRVQPVQVADHHLRRRRDRHHPHRQ